MPNSKSLLTAAAALALLAGAPTAASADALTNTLKNEAVWGSKGDGSGNIVAVRNNSSRDVWITYYNGPYQFEGQAGTQCIPPGKTNSFSWATWASNGGGQVRAEKKTAAHCGGSTTDDKVLTTGAPPGDVITITDNGINAISSTSTR